MPESVGGSLDELIEEVEIVKFSVKVYKNGFDSKQSAVLTGLDKDGNEITFESKIYTDFGSHKVVTDIIQTRKE